MRRLGVIGCIFLGLLMPGRLTEAAGKKIRERVNIAGAPPMACGGNSESGCGYDYSAEPGGDEPAELPFDSMPEPGCDHVPEPGCQFTPEPGCHYTPEPGCHHGPPRGGRGFLGGSGRGCCDWGGEPTCGGHGGLGGELFTEGMWDAMAGGLGDCCADACCPDLCCEPCCQCRGHASGLWAMGEALWFRYHRADGVRVGVNAGEDVEFDFEITPRITVGWVGPDGLGARLRFWEFDHNGDALDQALEPGSQVQVDTYLFDLEVFDTFCLNQQWDLELSAGIRYCEFLEQMQDIDAAETRLNAFTGFGGLASAELRRGVGAGVAWVRTRAAILMDDKDIFNGNGPDQVRLLDATVGMTELAFGYDLVMPLRRGAYVFAGVQLEWQNWYNFSSSFEDTANTEDFGGPSDVGFGGFGCRAGVAR